ncbi:MAG: hypothetical protein MI725_15555 [Pirellulales bacterium]|nr:hypothetical protein [Pirellulales bacterium]
MRNPAKLLSTEKKLPGEARATANLSPPVDPTCLSRLGADTKIVVGNAGDHPLALQLFVQAYQAPLAEDFQSRLDEPSYEPSDRLLLRRGEQLIGHVQVSKQIGWFQGQRCSLAQLQDFLTLPEYCASEFDAPLLALAESIATDEGSILALVRTDRPEWFASHGWSCCRGQGHTRANTRAILSHFDSPQQSQRRNTSALEVRTWRHFELESIQRVYGQLSTNMWGALHRSEECWQWLVGRKAHDQILIAVKKRPRKLKRSSDDPEENNMAVAPDVVGYAIIRDSCIVEMLTLPGFSVARPLLVARACRDAIDRDHHFVSLHTPAADPMHELSVTAGGSWISDGAITTGNWMLKLLSPSRWVERFYPVLHERAREAGIARPLEIDFSVADLCYRLTLTRRSSRLEQIAEAVQPHLRCDWLTFQDLLTSNLTFPEAIAQGRLRAQHDSALRTLAALFPPKLFWQSPFPLLQL